MIKVTIWKGSHGPQVRQLVERAWRGDGDLLILCPPALNTFDFVRFLPSDDITFAGEWTTTPDLSKLAKVKADFPATPVLGLFTTGTSGGEPRLVLYSRENIRSSLQAIVETAFETEWIDGIFCYPQPFHTFGLLLGYVLALERKWKLFTGGGPYSSQHHFSRARVQTLKLVTLGTPTHFLDLISYVKANNVVLPPTYSCIVGGAAVSIDLWKRLQTELMIEAPSIGYGATEASPGIAHLPAGRRPIEDGEIGLPLPNLELQLRPGEGYAFAGPSVCMAIVYANRIEFPNCITISDELEKRFDGTLLFRGRNDLVINRGGEKISLEAVERHLRECMALDSLAFAIPSTRLGQDLGLLIKAPFASQGIRERAVDALFARFNVRFSPDLFRLVSSFPMNSSQKPDRQAAVGILKLQVAL